MKLQNKVLIVDDSELNRSLLADMLQDEYELSLIHIFNILKKGLQNLP